MKVKRIIYGLSILTITAICSLNVQRSISVTDGAGYSSLTDLISLNTALAEETGGGCTGSICDDANGNHYGDFQAGSVLYCCGGISTSAGKKTL